MDLFNIIAIYCNHKATYRTPMNVIPLSTATYTFMLCPHKLKTPSHWIK